MNEYTYRAAEEAQRWMTTKQRGDETIVVKKDGAPAWLEQLVFDAHGDKLPDDWTYSVIDDAIDFIVDAGPDCYWDDLAMEFANNVDVYTSELTGWLHSRVDRYGYCDQFAESQGWEHVEGTTQLLSGGQYEERYEVFSSVLRSLEEQGAEIEEAEEDEDEDDD